MKSKFITVLMIIFFLFDLAGEEQNTFLEKLWNYAKNNNYSVQMAELKSKNAEDIYKNYWRELMPSVSLSMSSDFDFAKEKLISLSEEIVEAKILCGNFSFGTSFVMVPEMSLAVAGKDYNLADNKSKNNIDTVKLGLSISQKIDSEIFKISNKNLQKDNLFFKKEEALNLRNIEFSKCKEEIVELYLKCRRLIRRKESLKYLLNYLNMKKEGLQEENAKGYYSLIDIFRLDDEIQENYDKYNDILKEIAAAKTEMFLVAGILEKDMHFIEEMNFFDKLPEIMKEDCFDQNLEYFKIQEKIIENEFLLAKRNDSPLLQIGFSMPVMENESNSLWESSAARKKFSMNFSLNFNSECLQNGIKKKEYLECRGIFQQKAENIKAVTFQEKKYYLKQKLDTEHQMEFYEDLLMEKKRIQEAMNILLESGKCTLLEFEEAKISNIFVNEKLENLQDDNWYYFWMYQNRNYK